MHLRLTGEENQLILHHRTSPRNLAIGEYSMGLECQEAISDVVWRKDQVWPRQVSSEVDGERDTRGLRYLNQST